MHRRIGVWLPLRQLPDLWLGVTGPHADLGKNHHGLLELSHCLFAAVGGVEKVRQVVAQRGFAMAVTQGNDQRQRLLGQGDGPRQVAAVGAGQRQVVECRDAAAGVGQRFSDGQAVFEL